MANKPERMTFEQKQRLLELAREARVLLNSESFNKIVTHLVAEQIGILENSDVGSLTATTAHATVRALNQIKQGLRSLANNIEFEESKANV